MLPKSERLTKRDFATTRPKVVFRGTYMDIAANASDISKFACVISKKRIKRAVDRNKARRKIYHMVRETKPKNPSFIIIYPKQAVISGNRTLIWEELSKAFATL